MPVKESLVPLKLLLFSFHASNTIIVSFLPLYLKYRGLSGVEIGWVLAIGPLAAIFSQPFWGYMSDKYQTVKRMLLICVIGLIITSIIFFQMTTLTQILAMGAVFYFFTSPIGGLGDSMTQRRAGELGIAFGSIRTWGSIGFAISSLLIGNIFSIFGIQYILIPYLFFGFVALIVCFVLRDVEGGSSKLKFSDLKLLARNKPFFIFLFLILFLTVAHRANDSYIGLYITALGGSESMVGLAWFIGVASEALVFALSAFWFRKFHPLFFIIIAGALYTIRWFIYGLVDNPVWILVLQVMHGWTFAVFYMCAFEYVTRLIPKVLSSTGHLAFFATFFGVSGIIGSLLGGALIDGLGGSYLYLIMALMTMVGTILITLYHLLPYGKDTPNLV